MRPVLVMALVATTLTMIMCIISIALPYWIYQRTPRSGYQGLWESCISTLSGSTNQCQLIRLPPEFLDATRVMMCFGLVFYLFAVLCAFVFTFVKKEKTSLATAATVLCIFGGAFTMISIIVYGAKYPYLLDAKGMTLHVGYGLGVCSAIGGFVCSLLYCASKARGEID